MRTTLLVLPTVLLIALGAACDRAKISPHLSADITIQRTSPAVVRIKVHVKNDGERATVPLDVEVTAGPERLVMHPVPFVLNHQETRDLETSLATSAGVRATLTVKEAERGLTVVTKTATIE
ncbi:MAG: hypothetical protein ABSF98_11355 [Bryobacteraceae bacterium]|jgi:hypothetical protein